MSAEPEPVESCGAWARPLGVGWLAGTDDDVCLPQGSVAVVPLTRGFGPCYVQFNSRSEGRGRPR